MCAFVINTYLFANAFYLFASHLYYKPLTTNAHKLTDGTLLPIPEAFLHYERMETTQTSIKEQRTPGTFETENKIKNNKKNKKQKNKNKE